MIMKKYIIILVCSLLGVVSCYDDDSHVATKLLNNIVIDGLKDTSAISCSTVLDLIPEVSGYSEEELSYAWYIYGGEFEKQTDKGYRTVQIDSVKNLSWAVDVKKGDYTLVFEVTNKESGYAVMKEVKLTVSTAFSRGFYILKETSDGNTDLDIYNEGNKQLMTNVLDGTQGDAMRGKPRNLSVIYEKAHVDPETAASGYTTTVFVGAGERDMACFRTEDLVKIFDRSTLLYGEMSEEEVPYCMATAGAYNFFFSSKGIRGDYAGMFGSEYTTGRLGYPKGDGASSFVQACDGRGLMFWNEQQHRLCYFGGDEVEEIEYMGGEIIWDDVRAIATGWNHLAGENTMWYMFESQNGQRYLVLINPKFEVVEVRRLSSSLHIANADIIAGNGLSSYSIYSVHNNQLYRYSLSEDASEVLLSLPGSIEGQITYLSDIYFGKSFDYIVIGTQAGDNYALYMYEIQGGQPYGKPVHVVKGNGKIKQVRYVSQSITWAMMPNFYAFTDYASMFGMGPDFPY